MIGMIIPRFEIALGVLLADRVECLLFKLTTFYLFITASDYLKFIVLKFLDSLF